jgi:hypothetical protein
MNILHDTFQYRDIEELSEGSIRLFDCNILKNFGNFKAGETYKYLNIYYDDEIIVAYEYGAYDNEMTINETRFKLIPL